MWNELMYDLHDAVQEYLGNYSETVYWVDVVHKEYEIDYELQDVLEEVLDKYKEKFVEAYLKLMQKELP